MLLCCVFRTVISGGVLDSQAFTRVKTKLSQPLRGSRGNFRKGLPGWQPTIKFWLPNQQNGWWILIVCNGNDNGSV